MERAFAVSLYDPASGEPLEEQLVGVLDLVVSDSFRSVVVEHKTSARRYTEDQLRFDLQPTAYQLAARALGLGEVGLRFQVITEKRHRSPGRYS